MTTEQIFLGVIAAYNGIVGYFLKATIEDIKEAKNKQQSMELKIVNAIDKIASVETAYTTAIESQGKLFDLRMKNVEKTLEAINATLQESQRVLIHMDKNNAINAKSFERVMKLEDRILILESK
jgi:exonuclease III